MMKIIFKTFVFFVSCINLGKVFPDLVRFSEHFAHPAFTCSKLTIETLEQGAK